MKDSLRVDICVIGAGPGGLSVAAGASQMGASVVLVERGDLGGDCLNTGCVPSKALLAAGNIAWAIRNAGPFGIESQDPKIKDEDVYNHIYSVIDAIKANDSVERFEDLGVTVLRGHACFISPKRITVSSSSSSEIIRVEARRFVIATGSSPLLPPISGLDEVDYQTNKTIFQGPDLPGHLIVIGGGPIGIEVAQAHNNLGVRVTLLEMAAIMPKDDRELVDVLRCRLIKDGIDIIEGAVVTGVEKTVSGIAVAYKGNGEEGRCLIEGSNIIIAAGRCPNVNGLGLDEAGVLFSKKGVEVDVRLRTKNKRIFAIGDVVGGPQFTHVASYHAGVVIKNALFRWPARANYRCVPWVTYTSPELAQVGLTEAQAKKIGCAIRVLRWPYNDNDRAQAEALTEGMIKVVVTNKGKILGCGIVGAGAGELIQTWVLAISKNLKIDSIANIITPYPTLGEISKRVAGSFYTPKIFSIWTRRIVRIIRYFG